MTGRPATMSVPEAVEAFVPDGARVYIGNFGAQLFGVGHEIIRQGKRDLDAVIASGGILLDQMMGAGVLRSAVFGHCWSPIGPSPAWNFRRAAESGSRNIAFHELSLGLMTAALTGGAWGVPFMPVPGLPGTGFVDEDWSHGFLGTADTVFGASPVVRSIHPDVAFVHVDTADADGNGVVNGPLGEALLAAQASDRVVLVAEEVVTDGSVIAARPAVPGLLVDAVVHAPGSVRPDGVIGRHERDVAAYEEYSRRAATAEGFTAWLDELRSERMGAVHA